MPPQSRDQVQRMAAMGGAAIAVALSARALLKPRAKDTDSRLLDWESVRSNAYRRTHEAGPPLASDDLNAACDQDARELAPLLAEVCTDAPISVPRFQAIDRRGFADQNILIIKRISGPLEELRASVPQSHLTTMGRAATSKYVGEMLGFMSSRVLGQYDPVLVLGDAKVDAEPALYVVQPNLVAYRKKHEVDEHSLRRWLILHELTHAWQFGSHPWLAEYMQTTMQELMMSDVLNKDSIASNSLDPRSLAKHLPTAIRAQLAGVNKVQAVMSLLEGYANYVMNQVGARHLDDFKELEASFHKRRSDRSTLERIVLAITGVNMKLRQYEIGEKFCKEVVQQSSLEHLNKVWSGPQMLPSMAELKSPSLWVKRTS